MIDNEVINLHVDICRLGRAIALGADQTYWKSLSDVGINYLKAFPSGPSGNCTGFDIGVYWPPDNAVNSVYYTYNGGPYEAANSFIQALNSQSFQYANIPQSQTASKDPWSSQYGTYSVTTPLRALATICYVSGGVPCPNKPPSPPLSPPPPPSPFTASSPPTPPSPPPSPPPSSLYPTTEMCPTTGSQSGTYYCKNATGIDTYRVWANIPAWTLQVCNTSFISIYAAHVECVWS